MKSHNLALMLIQDFFFAANDGLLSRLCCLATRKQDMDGFHVEFLKNRNVFLLTDPKSRQFLQKWSLLNGIHVSSWAFNKKFHPLKVKDLVLDVINKARGTDVDFPGILKEDVIIEPIPCTTTSMEFFDRLLDPANGVVNRSGDGGIRGCFEETLDNFLVADELRQLLLNESSEVYPLFSETDRKELLFRLFMHFSLGGQYCQYEDFVQPYIDVAIVAYKTLLNVQKDPETGDVQIRSKCYRIIVPEEIVQNFMYIIIDPGLREATLFAHKI